jgi:predicted MPP superfamily phosphohydrolase
MGYEPYGLVVRREKIGIRDLPEGLVGLRIVQVTDVHHGPWVGMERVREVVERANALEPDLVVLTGDYVLKSAAYIGPVAEALGKLRAKIGIVGVLGNHDWREDGKLTQWALAHNGITLVDNTRVVLTPGRRLVRSAEAGLCIAGVGDYWEDKQDYERALGGVSAAMPRLLLTHNPDVAEERGLKPYRVDLMMCGHTHGGQIWVPGLGTPGITSKHGSKYARGLVNGPACRVYVSAGVGVAVLPVRFGVMPEINVVELGMWGRRRD